MKTANEIALEAKITVLEKDLKDLKDFEKTICFGCAKIAMSTMSNDTEFGLKGMKEIQEAVTERARINATREVQNRSSMGGQL